MACVWRSRISLGRDDFSLTLFNDRHGAHLASAALRPRSFAASMPLVERGLLAEPVISFFWLEPVIGGLPSGAGQSWRQGLSRSNFCSQRASRTRGEQFFFEVRFGLLKASVTRAGRLRLRDAGNVDQITVKRRKQS
jgi:hypothetical protein